MNKFVLMIFSVSIFFIGVGGVVKQIRVKFNPDDPRLVMIPRIETRNGERGKIKHLPLIEKSQGRILIEGDESNKSRVNFQLKRQFPFPPDKVIEFHRRLPSELLKRGMELPRFNEADTIIFLNENYEQVGTVEPGKREIPQVRVFIDKENKKQ